MHTGDLNNSMHTGIINFVSNNSSLISCGRAIYGMDFDSFGGRSGRIENGINLFTNSPLHVDYTRVSQAACNMYDHICADYLS